MFLQQKMNGAWNFSQLKTMLEDQLLVPLLLANLLNAKLSTYQGSMNGPFLSKTLLEGLRFVRILKLRGEACFIN